MLIMLKSVSGLRIQRSSVVEGVLTRGIRVFLFFVFLKIRVKFVFCLLFFSCLFNRALQLRFRSQSRDMPILSNFLYLIGA